MTIDRRALLALGGLAMTGAMTGALAAGAPGPKILFQGDLMADYFQIYLRDAAHPDLPDDYTDTAMARRLVAGPYAIILHTARNMPVPIRVEWHADRPPLDLAAEQHVIEAGFDCPSGRLVLAGLTDYEPSAARLTVPAGWIGVRASFRGLDTLSADGLSGDDRYVLQLWPGAVPEGVRVLKAGPAG